MVSWEGEVPLILSQVSVERVPSILSMHDYLAFGRRADTQLQLDC